MTVDHKIDGKSVGLPQHPEPYSRPASHPDAEYALARLEFPEKEVEKSGFANTVTADDGNLWPG